MLVINLLSIAVGLVGLFFGGEWLVRAASRLAVALGISPLVISLTVVAVGTSMPELLVSISASVQGSNGIVIGNVIGSNIANVGLILGVAGLIYPIAVDWAFLRREIPILIGVSALALLVCYDGVIGPMEGACLVVAFIAYNLFAVLIARRASRKTQREVAEAEAAEGLIDAATARGKPRRWREMGRFGVGLVLLLIGAQLLVNGAVAIATDLNIPEIIIGLTLVAVGTSLPELSTSIIASLRKHSDIVLGNAVGSNIANILLILGVASLIRPVTVGSSLAAFELPVMFGFTLLLPVLAFRRRIARWQSGVLLAAYISFVVAAFLRG